MLAPKGQPSEVLEVEDQEELLLSQRTLGVQDKAL